MKDRFIPVYANITKEFATLSRARRLKVGAIIVKEDKLISCGFNGTPSGWDNDCESEITRMTGEGPPELVIYKELITKPETIHAEHNAIYKLAKSNESGKDAVMFCTHSPCIECAKGIYMSGINEFYYGELYRSNDGLEFLAKCNVKTIKWT